jgi:hypothetical protein
MQKQKLPRAPVAVRTIVSTSIIDHMAAKKNRNKRNSHWIQIYRRTDQDTGRGRTGRKIYFSGLRGERISGRKLCKR